MATSWTLGCDATDPHQLAAFWAQALGYVTEPGYDEPDGASIIDPDGKGPAIGFLRVPEGKAAKNRMHIDIHPPLDLGVPGLVARLEQLGGTRVGEPVTELLEEIGVWWQLMRDPEGNELDVVADPGHPAP